MRLVGELSRFVRDPVTIESAMVNSIFDIAEDLSTENASLLAENTRLRGLLAEKVVTSTMLTGLVPDDGGMTLGFEGGACGMLAQVFGDQFYESKAINYLELRFDSAKHPELGALVVTLQRVEGKTPHQLREVAEVQVQTLLGQVKALQSDANSWQSGYDEGRRMTTKTALGERQDAARWNAFINCARIKFFGWAGYDERDPNGNKPGNYRHFGGEFWTIHDATTADKDKAKRLLTGFADAAIAHASVVAADE